MLSPASQTARVRAPVQQCRETPDQSRVSASRRNRSLVAAYRSVVGFAFATPRPPCCELFAFGSVASVGFKHFFQNKQSGEGKSNHQVIHLLSKPNSHCTNKEVVLTREYYELQYFCLNAQTKHRTRPFAPRTSTRQSRATQFNNVLGTAFCGTVTKSSVLCFLRGFPNRSLCIYPRMYGKNVRACQVNFACTDLGPRLRLLAHSCSYDSRFLKATR